MNLGFADHQMFEMKQSNENTMRGEGGGVKCL